MLEVALKVNRLGVSISGECNNTAMIKFPKGIQKYYIAYGSHICVFLILYFCIRNDVYIHSKINCTVGHFETRLLVTVKPSLLPRQRCLKSVQRRGKARFVFIAKCRFKISITLPMNRELGSDSLPPADLTRFAATEPRTFARTKQSFDLFYRIRDRYCRSERREIVIQAGNTPHELNNGNVKK